MINLQTVLKNTNAHRLHYEHNIQTQKKKSKKIFVGVNFTYWKCRNNLCI